MRDGENVKTTSQRRQQIQEMIMTSIAHKRGGVPISRTELLGMLDDLEEGQHRGACLELALHAFRSVLSYDARNGLAARGELACMIGLRAEGQHVRMGILGFEEEQQVRASIIALGGRRE